MTDKESKETSSTQGDPLPEEVEAEEVERKEAEPASEVPEEMAPEAARVATESQTHDAARHENSLAEVSVTADSTTGEANPDADEVESTVVVKKVGRGVLWFALLIALGALAGSAYLYYELIYLNPLADLEQNIEGSAAARTSELSSVRESVQQQTSSLRAEVQAARAAQTAELAETQAGVMSSLQQALLAAPPSQREWKLAEAEYLLRIGNHRVLMEQDTDGALTLFLAVDQILAELDDFAFHQVRAILADEIIALRQVPRSDLQGIYLRLEAIKSSLDRIIFKTPEYVVTQVEQDAEETVWSRLVKESTKFFEFRELGSDETIKPLLAPAQEHYLELNLRLALEQAQLAALKRQQIVFEHALQNVRDWLAQYTEDSQQVLGDEVEELLKLKLERPLPDISRSLVELNRARQGGE